MAGVTVKVLNGFRFAVLDVLFGVLKQRPRERGNAGRFVSLCMKRSVVRPLSHIHIELFSLSPYPFRLNPN